MYEYKVELDRVVDGDTVDVFVDLGFDVIKAERVRLLGIDAPETRTKDPVEKDAGQRATDFVENWFGRRVFNGDDVYLRTTKVGSKGKYGRFLGVFFYVDDVEDNQGQYATEVILNEELLDKGLAKEYGG